MKLEQITKEEKISTADLERLSFSILYTGDLPSMSIGGAAFINRDKDSYLNEPIIFPTQTSYKDVPFTPIEMPKIDFTLKATTNSYKIFDENSKINAPLLRLDLKPHEFGDIHIQHGKKDYFDRKGDEAADIFAEIYRLNPSIKFDWEK